MNCYRTDGYGQRYELCGMKQVEDQQHHHGLWNSEVSGLISSTESLVQDKYYFCVPSYLHVTHEHPL